MQNCHTKDHRAGSPRVVVMALHQALPAVACNCLYSRRLFWVGLRQNTANMSLVPHNDFCGVSEDSGLGPSPCHPTHDELLERGTLAGYLNLNHQNMARHGPPSRTVSVKEMATDVGQ